MNKKKVCIIGAGIGGLTAGALLTKKDYDVTIFEKESLIGGRALTFNFSNLTFKEYKKILSTYNMNIPFSEPDLKKIFEKNCTKTINNVSMQKKKIKNTRDLFQESSP